MDKGAEQKIRSLAGQVADELGVELVDVVLYGRGKRSLLRVTIDREGSVTLDDCERFSRRLEGYLDVEDLIAQSYTLEVSSPGLDRPLKTLDDMKRSIGKMVRIVMSEAIDDQSFFRGKIREVRDGIIILSVEEKQGPPREVVIPYDRVSKAQLEIEVQ